MQVTHSHAFKECVRLLVGVYVFAWLMVMFTPCYASLPPPGSIV
jgi:hypothetical protein